VLLTNRTVATLVAAVSVIALLIDTIRLIFVGVLDSNALFPAGLLGALIFGVSIMIQVVASRLGRAEELARDRASDLYNLQRLNEQIVQHMDTGILLVTSDGVVRVMNKSAAGLLAPDRPVTVEQGRQLADYSDELAYQFEHWRDSGQHRARPFHITDDAPAVIARFRQLQPSTEGESLVFVEDYTPITQYAQSLKLTSLGRLTASIAHEIRNPLTAISHASQLMEDTADSSASEQQALREIIANNTQRVNEIIENILLLSRRGDAKQEPLDLLAWLRLFIPEYEQGQTHGACVTLRAPKPVGTISFDPSHLRRILTNLLDNGVRHGGERTGQFAVTLELSKDIASNRAHMDVIDAGSGVPDTMRDRLFEPFFTTSPQGSGLGLYLCRELCASNNATLSYDRTEDEGTRFRVAIPLQGRSA